MYAIRGLCHRTDITMSAHGFAVDLSPEWREAVGKSGLGQAEIDSYLRNAGRQWLDCAGYDAWYDPDNCGAWADPKKPRGPNARKMYEPCRDMRVMWGEWGPEHITVPGNACGLDIDRHTFGSLYHEGRMLQPHNVDSLKQKYLLLIVFTQIAESVILFAHR